MSSSAGEQGSEQPTNAAPPFPFDAVDVTHTAAAAGVLDAARALAAVTVESLSDDECLGVFDQLETISRCLAAATADVLGEIDTRDLCDRRYGTTTRIWWERRHGRSRTSVGRSAATARKLRSHLPVIAAALAAGDIAYERVELIASKVNARNTEALAAAQQGLLALSAAEPSFRTFAALVDNLAALADGYGPHDPNDTASTLNTHRVGNEVVLNGTFTGADGATLEELLDAALTRLVRAWARDIEQCPELKMPPINQLRAQALLGLIRDAAGASTSDRNRPVVTELTLVVDADRVEDLDPILAAVLNGHTWPKPANPFNGHAGSCANASGPGDIIGLPVTTGTGKQVWFSAQQWQLLVCNTDISEVLLDHLGMPIAVRDRLRTPTRAMRRALAARDSGCVFPGCDATPGRCDAHHVIEWQHGGDTAIVNLVLLCRRHHSIVHRTGWNIRLTHLDRTDPADTSAPGNRVQGLFTITTAGGLEFPTQHRPRPPDRQLQQQPPPDPQRRQRQQPPGQPPDRQRQLA